MTKLGALFGIPALKSEGGRLSLPPFAVSPWILCVYCTFASHEEITLVYPCVSFPPCHSSFNTPLSRRQSILTSAACEHPNLVSFSVGKKWIYASGCCDSISSKRQEKVLTCRGESRPLTGCIIHGCLINNSASDVRPGVAW